MNKTVKDIIVRTARLGLRLQKSNGSMPASHNGSRYHLETPTRSACHWSIIFFTAYKLSQDACFFNAGKNCIAYLLDSARKPFGYTYTLRVNQDKDMCNGLIGQAWVLEALINSYQYLKSEQSRIRTKITELIETIPFNNSKKVWEVIEIDGKNKGIDKTYNHQLWYAVQCYSAAKLFNLAKQEKNALEFFKNTNSGHNIWIHKSGLISHYVAPTFQRFGFLAILLFLFVKLVDVAEQNKYSKVLELPLINKYYKQCLGYQMFNLYAFAILYNLDKDVFPQLVLTNIDRLLRIASVSQYFKRFPSKGYGYNNNPIGFEAAFVELVLRKDIKSASSWIERQLVNYFTIDLYPTNTDDPNLLQSRVYELCRLT